jgi:hypothetical protein
MKLGRSTLTTGGLFMPGSIPSPRGPLYLNTRLTLHLVILQSVKRTTSCGVRFADNMEKSRASIYGTEGWRFESSGVYLMEVGSGLAPAARGKARRTSVYLTDVLKTRRLRKRAKNAALSSIDFPIRQAVSRELGGSPRFGSERQQ